MNGLIFHCLNGKVLHGESVLHGEIVFFFVQHRGLKSVLQQKGKFCEVSIFSISIFDGKKGETLHGADGSVDQKLLSLFVNKLITDPDLC